MLAETNEDGVHLDGLNLPKLRSNIASCSESSIGLAYRPDRCGVARSGSHDFCAASTDDSMSANTRGAAMQSATNRSKSETDATAVGIVAWRSPSSSRASVTTW